MSLFRFNNLLAASQGGSSVQNGLNVNRQCACSGSIICLRHHRESVLFKMVSKSIDNVPVPVQYSACGITGGEFCSQCNKCHQTMIPFQLNTLPALQHCGSSIPNGLHVDSQCPRSIQTAGFMKRNRMILISK